MTLNDYTLRAPSTVILADDRDPDVSWQHHLERTGGLRGGVDIVAPEGTPVLARTAGRMVFIPNDGSAGNSCRFYHRDNDGWKDVFSHLSSYRTPLNPGGLNGFEYEAGDIVAYTGTSGGVAPHLHWHLLDPEGVRRNPWDHFTPPSAPAGDLGQIIPTTIGKKEDTMKLAHIPNGGANGQHLFLLFGERLYVEFTGQAAASAFSAQIGGASAPASRSFFDLVARQQGITQRVEIVDLPDEELAAG